MIIEFIKYMIDCHIFFVKETNNYIIGMPLINKLYYPIAYFKFMNYSFNDFKWKK